MAQNISKQVEKLEKFVDEFYKECTEELGHSHPLSKKALKIFLYFQGLSCDCKGSKKDK